MGLGLLARFGSSDGGPAGDEAADENGKETNLYHCTTCEAVYVAVDKTVCSQCDTDVEQVRSTFRHSSA